MWLVLRRPLRGIDDENLGGPSLRIKLQPELLLERREERRAIEVANPMAVKPPVRFPIRATVS
jgi:hypothetical protein